MKISARYRNQNNTTTHIILTTTTDPLHTLSNILAKSPPDTTHIDCRLTLDPATPEGQTWEDFTLPARTIEIMGKRCTAARWLSFGWVVSRTQPAHL